MSWDEASERRLAELWGAGWSATLIGAEIGQTRNELEAALFVPRAAGKAASA